MSRDELIDWIALYIDDNNNNEIDWERLHDGLNNLLDALLPAATAAEDGRVPFTDGGEYTSSEALQVLAGIVTIQKMALENGVSYVDYIYDSGIYTGNEHTTLITMYRAKRLNRVIGLIPTPIEISTQLAIGQTLTLEGGTSHEIVEGDTFLLKSQTDPTENGAYTVHSDTAALAEWYDDSIQQMIFVDQGIRSFQILAPAVDGAAPVLPDMGEQALHLFHLNN